MVKRSLFGLFGKKPRTNVWIIDGVSSSSRGIRDGAATFRALDIIYNSEAGVGSNRLVRWIDWFWLHVRNAQAVRNRLEIVRSELCTAIEEHAHREQPVRILVIAAGFVLRAVSGGVATDIYLSRWFVIVTACCAVFLVAAKRYAELRARGDSTPARATLRSYRSWQLRFTLIAAASVAVVAYASWAFTRPNHLLWYGLSIVPLALWLVRYSALIGGGGGQAPEDLILGDRALVVLGVVWGALFIGGVYVGN